MTRRQLFRAGVTGAVLISAAAGAPIAAARPARRGELPKVYVLVIDGLRPDEVTPALMPTVAALRAAGMAYPRASSLPVAETHPNHTMMMTGVRPDRNGVPANTVFDRDEGAVRDVDRPGDMTAVTVLEQARAKGLTSGTVLSKTGLFSLFGERATYRWEPGPTDPVTNHAIDPLTSDALQAMITEVDPQLVFASFGSTDRFGHGDYTGTTLKVARTAALAIADREVADVVGLLRRTGRWERSVLLVTADHSMDWSVPTNVISTSLLIDADPVLAGNVVPSQNGGAVCLSWIGPDADREAGLARLAVVVAAHPGVLRVVDTASERLGPKAGDLVAYCRAGWRFSDPTLVSNPIPGNHGHPATYPIPMFVSGGHPGLVRGSSTAAATNLDIAPTVGALLRLPNPGWEGRPRREAFTKALVG